MQVSTGRDSYAGAPGATRKTKADAAAARRYRAKRRPVYGPVLFGDAPHPSLSVRALRCAFLAARKPRAYIRVCPFDVYVSPFRAFYDAKRRSQGVLWSVRRELCNDCPLGSIKYMKTLDLSEAAAFLHMHPEGGRGRSGASFPALKSVDAGFLLTLILRISFVRSIR